MMRFRKLKAWFPSWRISLIGICVGFGIGYGLHLIEDGGMGANHFIWHIVLRLGWWWWGIPVVISIVALYYMGRLDPARTTAGRAARMLHLVGFIFYICSCFVNGLGLVAPILIAFGSLLMIRQVANACTAKRKASKPDTHVPFGLRFLLSLTDQGI